MKTLVRFIASVALGFLSMWPLAYLFDACGWRWFNGWALVHGTFVIAWPILSLTAYFICKHVPGLKA